MSMKFVKGMIMGGIISAGAMMMYNEMSGKNKKQLKNSQIKTAMG